MTSATAIVPNAATDYLLDDYQLQRHGRLVSLATPVPDVTLERFLRYARGHARFFWRDGRSGITMAGMGVAVDLMAWGEARFVGIGRQARELFAHAVHSEAVNAEAVNAEAMAALAVPRLFGGFAFRDDFVPDFAWHGFHPAHFVLPHYQLVQHGDQRWLTLNVLLPADQAPSQAAPQLREALAQCHAELRTVVRGNIAEGNALESAQQQKPAPSLGYPMPYATWAEMIGRAHGRFAAGDLQKVVLARVCEVRQTSGVDLDGALAYLQSHYPECFTFLFEPQPGHAFFGATPELLAATRGRTLETMALAGSIQRGRTPAEDAALADELLHSAKDRHEHALVVGSLRRRLEPLVDDLTLPDAPGVYTLRNIQHLHTPVQARLRASSTGILPVVEALHPTPALGGTPREDALAFIREAESVPRGWYAGPVGWIDPNLDGAFGVAIRSAVAQKKRAWLYAGAGIVAASDPQKEWTETEWKFRPIQAALGAAP